MIDGDFCGVIWDISTYRSQHHLPGFLQGSMLGVPAYCFTAERVMFVLRLFTINTSVFILRNLLVNVKRKTCKLCVYMKTQQRKGQHGFFPRGISNFGSHLGQRFFSQFL